MANKEEKPDEQKSSWKDAIYNPRTGEFIGRTASSWGKSELFDKCRQHDLKNNPHEH